MPLAGANHFDVLEGLQHVDGIVTRANQRGESGVAAEAAECFAKPP